MKYKNPYYKKVRGSMLLELSCSHCKMHLLNYQKVGKGNVRMLHIERIIEASFDCFIFEKEMTCPSCGTRLGLLDQQHFRYRMVRGHTLQKIIL